MDISELTLAEFREQRPDLVQSIRSEVTEGIETEQEREQLKSEITRLKEENKTLKADKDKLELKEQAREREQQMLGLLDEADLPKQYISDTFKEQLRECEDEAKMKTLVEDRKTLVASQQGGGVQGMGASHTVEESMDSDGQRGDELFASALGIQKGA